MEKGNEHDETLTRWEALREIIDSNQCRDAIAAAWPLYFYALFHGDRDKQLVTSYPELNEKLGAPIPTIKRWKEYLIEKKVANAVQGKHRWTLKLLPPYDTPLTCLKSDYTEIMIKSDNETQKLMKRMFSSDSMSLLPLIAELAHKVERLEQKKT